MPDEWGDPPVPDVTRHPEDVVEAAMRPDGERVVLAVSGGRDSMALLHAMARLAPHRVAVVATFDHGTGEAARAAAALVVAESRRMGVPVVRERALRPGRTEAAWREARWAFLHRVARAYGVPVATAHTADDQLETIVQRLLRGAGARGLAALAAPGPVVRPWLSLRRSTVAAYAESLGLSWVEDPSNQDRRHQRVRVRLDLLPALERAQPGFGAAMLALGERAAAWRGDVDGLVASLPWAQVAPGTWQLPRQVLAGWDAESLAVIWPALLAAVGARLTAEGTQRLVRFTIGESQAGELRLPGGAAVVRRRDVFEVRGAQAVERSRAGRAAAPRVVPVGTAVSWPGWQLVPSPLPAEEALVTESSLLAAFPASGVLEVRGWAPGDRIRTAGLGAGRRISRYLAECGIPRLDRPGWPVVLLNGEIVWVPGVCRGLAAPHRSGRSDLIWYRSERDFG